MAILLYQKIGLDNDLVKGKKKMAECNKSRDQVCRLLEEASRPATTEVVGPSPHHVEPSFFIEYRAPLKIHLAPEVPKATKLPNLGIKGNGITDEAMAETSKEGPKTSIGPERSATTVVEKIEGVSQRGEEETRTSNSVKPNLGTANAPEGEIAAEETSEKTIVA